MMFFDFFVFRSTVNASFSYHTAKPNMHTHSEIKYQLHQLLQSPQDICSGVHCVYYLPQTCCASAAAESNQTVILFIEALVLDLSTFTKIFYIFRYIDACDISPNIQQTCTPYLFLLAKYPLSSPKPFW